MAERANVLLAGSGAREHAMAVELAKSPLVGEIFIAPGNAGTAQVGTNVPVDATDIPRLVSSAKDHNVSLATAGSENTLVLGFVDSMKEAGIDAYGTDQKQTRLETDKIYSQKLMEACGIPCPAGVGAENYEEALAFLENPPWDFVIKAAGPCGGKGVELPKNIEEARRIVYQFMVEGKHEDAGKRILFQKREHGPETSLIAFVSGETIVGMPLTTDYKLKNTGNSGPNTGGMGCIIDLGARAPKDWIDRYMRPAVEHLARIGEPLNTKLYAQLIHTSEGIKVLEFNARGGDPETQTQYRLLRPEVDYYKVLRKSLDGKLNPDDIVFDYQKAASCLVLAAEGYPEDPVKGDRIRGLESRLEEGVVLFHAGTKFDKNGNVITGGGRVLNITATGNSLPEAVAKMYREVDKREIEFRGMWNREDIGVIYGNN